MEASLCFHHAEICLAYLSTSITHIVVLTLNLLTMSTLLKDVLKTQLMVMLSESKETRNVSTNLHLLECKHQVFAGGSQNLSVVVSDTDSQHSVTVCGTTCKTPGKVKPF
jgi:hypothetical protein